MTAHAKDVRTHKYPIAETFYSLKGEGEWTGTPMFFIRFAGCNLDCAFCDTKYAQVAKKEMTIDELLEEVGKYPFQMDRVVLTGGEPTLHPIAPLIDMLQVEGYSVHLETNGTNDVYTHIDWVTVSPKSPHMQLSHQALSHAHELKFLVGKLDETMEELYKSSEAPAWQNYIFSVLSTADINAELLVMPIANITSRTMDALDKFNTQLAVEWCLNNPGFKLTLQVHKILNIQ